MKTTDNKKERIVLARIDITRLPNGEIQHTSMDFYGKYEKELPEVKPSEEKVFGKHTTVEELIQHTLEDNFETKTRASIIQQLVDSFDMKYTKAATLYNKLAEKRKTK